MPAVTKLGDISVGHSGSHGPIAATSGAGTVFVNNQPVHRIGDTWTAVHPPGPPPTATAGSGTVKAENVGVARIGDNISCGDAIAQGSENVFAG